MATQDIKKLIDNLTVESSRLFRPVWKVSNFQAIENKEIRSMGDARISILEVLKNQILRRTFDCQVLGKKCPEDWKCGTLMDDR